MDAFNKRVHFAGREYIGIDLHTKLMGLPTNTLRSGEVAQYAALTPYLGQIEELEMKTKLEIVDELVDLMFDNVAATR